MAAMNSAAVPLLAMLALCLLASGAAGSGSDAVVPMKITYTFQGEWLYALHAFRECILCAWLESWLCSALTRCTCLHPLPRSLAGASMAAVCLCGEHDSICACFHEHSASL